MATVKSPMANTAIRTEGFRFAVDQQTLWHAEKRAPAFVPRKHQLAAGPVGGAIASRQLTGAFFSRLLTPVGEYELSVDDAGLAISHPGVSPTVLRWSKIDAWSIDKHAFLARDTSGNTVILPRAALPPDVFDVVVEICDATLKGAQISTTRNYGQWANLGKGEKIVRGAIYTLGAVVLLASLLVFTLLGVDGAFSSFTDTRTTQ